jgi:hypothetical protein
MRTQNVLSRSRKYAHLHHIRDSGHKDVQGSVRIKLTTVHVIIVAGVQLYLPLKPTWRNR